MTMVELTYWGDHHVDVIRMMECLYVLGRKEGIITPGISP